MHNLFKHPSGGEAMISETEFAELGNSLVTGFFADNVILALTRTERIEGLQSRDERTLKKAIKLLGNILLGRKWVESRRVNSKSAETALALNRAVHALPDITMPDDFVAYIKELKATLVNLVQNGQEDKDRIVKVRSFFDNYARALSEESQNIIEKSSEPSRVATCVQLVQESI